MASITTPLTNLISHPLPLFLSSALLRAIMLVYGLWQDANSPLKYTDIDYLVFTDAARFAFSSSSLSPSNSNSNDTINIPSPYERETYRYTPLLSWLLYPTTLTTSTNNILNMVAFSTGKILFAGADLLAGYFLLLILQRQHHSKRRGRREGGRGDMGPSSSSSLTHACRFASIWLLNPMVATISTRGSSEGLLGVLVTALLWAVLSRRTALAGALLGLGVHFKIYPFIYAPAVVWWMDEENMTTTPTTTTTTTTTTAATKKGGEAVNQSKAWIGKMANFVTPSRIVLTLTSLATFAALNAAMYHLYGFPFITHTYLHHVTRIDHRHNFSPYNVLLYLTSSSSSPSLPFPSNQPFFLSPLPSTSTFASPRTWISNIKIESIAFMPQLLLSTILIPLAGAKRDLPTTMLAQTFAFVTFNKVCTSQYFLWYMIFLPLYLPHSSLLRKPVLGLTTLVLWVVTQGLWLQQGYNLEFLGISTFVPGLWLSSLAFFAVNCFLLGIIIDDLGSSSSHV